MGVRADGAGTQEAAGRGPDDPAPPPGEASTPSTPDMWERWVPVAFVPAVVAVAHLGAQGSPALRFLLVPPLAVLAERASMQPQAPATRFASMVVGPTVGALLGTAAAVVLGSGMLAVVLVTLVMVALLRLLHWQMPPTLAISLLPLVLHWRAAAYPLDVLVATGGLWLTVRVLARLRRAWDRRTAGLV